MAKIIYSERARVTNNGQAYPCFWVSGKLQQIKVVDAYQGVRYLMEVKAIYFQDRGDEDGKVVINKEDLLPDGFTREAAIRQTIKGLDIVTGKQIGRAHV